MGIPLRLCPCGPPARSREFLAKCAEFRIGTAHAWVERFEVALDSDTRKAQRSRYEAYQRSVDEVGPPEVASPGRLFGRRKAPEEFDDTVKRPVAYEVGDEDRDTQPDRRCGAHGVRLGEYPDTDPHTSIRYTGHSEMGEVR